MIPLFRRNPTVTFIYALPLWFVAAAMAGSVILWAGLHNRSGRRWKLFNAGLFIVSLLVIFFATVLHRTPESRSLILTPFYSFQLAKEQPELYREVVMNVFLFVPFGLSFSALLPAKWRCSLRIILCCLSAFLLSSLVEYLQYRFCLGLTEVDDVIFNTLGALIGAGQLIAAGFFAKHVKKY